MQKRMLPLKALKPHLYGTRRLEAGDEYEAPVEEAIAQVAMRRADFVKGKKPSVPAPSLEPKPEPVPEPKPEPAPAPKPAETADIDSLRLQARQLGIYIDLRWGMARLQYEIAKARG